MANNKRSRGSTSTERSTAHARKPASDRKRSQKSPAQAVRLHFMGAARTVTGSLHFFEAVDAEGKSVRFFCDFGLNQENPGRNRQNRLPAGMRMSDVDFGIVSHPHIDHVGGVPLAVKNGFKGKIYATPATVDLSGILLPDSGYLQENEAKRRTRKNVRRCAEAAEEKRTVRGCDEDEVQVEPLYTEAEAVASLSHFQPVEFDQLFTVRPGISFKFTPASHLLGAAVVTLELGVGAKKRRVVFSGDLGRPDMPILRNLAPVKHADYLICEGTYGTKTHVKRDRLQALADIINRAYERANKPEKANGYGAIIFPAFAVGRVQALLYDLKQLIAKKKIPNMPVFVDSPLAIKASGIYRRYTQLYNARATKLLAEGGDLFSPPRFAELETWQQSLVLDKPASEPIIIVGSSGMAVGGRILRHLENRLSGKNNTVVFIGFQGVATLGRQLTTPNITEAKVAGKMVPVRATIEHMGDYSGHADVEDITRWLHGFQVRPRKMFLVHGEEESLLALEEHIETTMGWDVEVPNHGDIVSLE